MAEHNQIEQIKNNEPAPYIIGGTTRPSIRVDLSKFETIQRRQELNAVLLQASCAVGAPTPPVFKLEDLGLLLQIAREHDSNGNPLIRKQAIRALEQLRSLEAVEFLWTLASNESEHESLRIQAISALGRAAPTLAASLFETCLVHPSPMTRGAAARALGGVGDLRTLDRLRDIYQQEPDRGVREKMAAASRIIAGRF
jgi:HEAT repeat protein